MLAARFRGTVGAKLNRNQGGQQKPWLSERRAQSVGRTDTRKMAIPVMANRIITVRHADGSLFPPPKNEGHWFVPL